MRFYEHLLCVWAGAWEFAFEKHSLCVGHVPKDFEIFLKFSLYWGTLPNFDENPCVWEFPCVWGSDSTLALKKNVVHYFGVQSRIYAERSTQV